MRGGFAGYGGGVWGGGGGEVVGVRVREAVARVGAGTVVGVWV